MRNLTLFWALVFSVFISFSGTALAADAVYDDLWDISQGAIMGNHSALMNYSALWMSDIENMFGGTTASAAISEADNTVFGDANPDGYVHYVEWETPNSVTLEGFKLFALTLPNRMFKEFKLSYDDGQGNWTNLYTWNLTGETYGGNPDNLFELEITLDSPVLAKYFKAEFTQAGDYGPRIIELDGYGTTGSPVPVPGAVWLLGTGLISLAGIRRRNISS